MRRNILWLGALAVLLGLQTGRAEWTMVVHGAGRSAEFPVDSIQSVTFYNPPPMVSLPPGTFTMGDGSSNCGRDQRQVTLTHGFMLALHETTNQEYLDALQWAYDHGYVTATTASVSDGLDGCSEELVDLDDMECEIQFDGVGGFYLRQSPSPEAQQAYPNGYEPSTHPAKKVSWFGAVRYCDWLSLQAGLPRSYQHTGDWTCNGGDPYGALGFRLPTDAEWEYAGRYNDERIYPWGNEPPDCSRANWRPSPSYWCVHWTTPVGSYPAGSAELGLADMAGNAYEWCNDWWVCDVGTAPITDPPGPSGGTWRMLRGGSCWDVYGIQCAGRFQRVPSACAGDIGLRVARTATR